MRLISIDAARPGMKVGRAIWNEVGHALLQKNVLLTDSIISRLKQMNIQYIYIEDEISKGIEIKETVPIEKRKKAINQIANTFQQVRGLDTHNASYVLDKQSKVIGNVIDDLLDSILNSNELLTVLSDTFMYDESLFQHSFNVALYSLATARELGYSVEDLRTIGIGAILHDVGKMIVPQNILQKQDQLTDEEFNIMKRHTRYGFDMLRNLHTVSLLVAHCAFQHHERLDGSGYPRGLVECEIHPYAKIIAVADVFDAVTSDRVYREKMLPSQGIAIIESGSGTLFDERIVKAFKRSVVHYQNGTVVYLSDGRRGIVVKQNVNNSVSPWVRIFAHNGTLLRSTYLINLEEHSDVTIERVETDYLQYVE